MGSGLNRGSGVSLSESNSTSRVVSSSLFTNTPFSERSSLKRGQPGVVSGEGGLDGGVPSSMRILGRSGVEDGTGAGEEQFGRSGMGCWLWLIPFYAIRDFPS